MTSQPIGHRANRSGNGLTLTAYLVAGLMTSFVFGCGTGHRDILPGSMLSEDTAATGKSKLNSAQQADVYLSLGRSAESQGNLTEALRMYESAIVKQPKSGLAHWRLAVCLDKSGNFEKSADHYADAIKHLPGDAEIYCDFGYSLLIQERWRDAEMQLKQAIALKPELRRAHNNLGIVLAQGSNLEEARKEFQLGGLAVPDVHWNVAQTLIAQSRWDEARGEFQRVLSINPQNAEVAGALQGLERMVARLDRLENPTPAADPELMRASAKPAR